MCIICEDTSLALGLVTHVGGCDPCLPWYPGVAGNEDWRKHGPWGHLHQKSQLCICWSQCQLQMWWFLTLTMDPRQSVSCCCCWLICSFFFIYIYMKLEYIYIQEISPLSDVRLGKSLFPVYKLLLFPIDGVLCIIEAFQFYEVLFLDFSACTVGVLFEMLFPMPMCWRLVSTFLLLCSEYLVSYWGIWYIWSCVLYEVISMDLFVPCTCSSPVWTTTFVEYAFCFSQCVFMCILLKISCSTCVDYVWVFHSIPWPKMSFLWWCHFVVIAVFL